MKKLLFLIVFSFSFAAYNIGQTISLSDQGLQREVCFASENSDYSIGDDLSLLSLNGAENGGDYHVFFIDMSATW